jgi:nucleotide-binding universal stress UspA family protein
MIPFNTSRILIPVDFSETSLLAIQHGAFVAQYTRGDVYLLHVVNSTYTRQNMFLPVVEVDNLELERKIETKMNELAHDIRTQYGVNVECVIKTGIPANEIIDTVAELTINLVVMGTHGYSPLEELVIGSNALRVITKANCQVMTMSKEATRKGYNRILIPIDNSAHSRQKVNYAIQMAHEFSASLHPVGLLGSDEEGRRGTMEVIMSQIQVLAKEKNVYCKSDILENVKNRASATVKFAEEVGADLIVIMSDQDAELSGFFLGPYAQQVIHLSKIPVLTIKPKELSGPTNISIMSGTSGN